MLMKFSLILPDKSCEMLLGKWLQSGRISSNPNALARLNSARQVPLVILSHSSLVGKTTLWSRQEMMGNPYRQRNGTASCSQVWVASWSGNRNWFRWLYLGRKNFRNSSNTISIQNLLTGTLSMSEMKRNFIDFGVIYVHRHKTCYH